VATRSSPCVYVVDDERIVTSTLTQILKRSGLTALGFVNPIDALRESEFSEPALLVSDVVMPNLTGIELAAEIRSKYPNCKILLLSGESITTDLLEADHSLERDYVLLAKPIHPIQLIAMIERLLKWQPCNSS
jgi:DNA-binding NtrC family response regulator